MWSTNKYQGGYICKYRSHAGGCIICDIRQKWKIVWTGVVIILHSGQKGCPFSRIFVLKQTIILILVCLISKEYITSHSHQRCIQNPVKHIYSIITVLLSILIQYYYYSITPKTEIFHKKLHIRCLSGFWIRFWSF